MNMSGFNARTAEGQSRETKIVSVRKKKKEVQKNNGRRRY